MTQPDGTPDFDQHAQDLLLVAEVAAHIGRDETSGLGAFADAIVKPTFSDADSRGYKFVVDWGKRNLQDSIANLSPESKEPVNRLLGILGVEQTVDGYVPVHEHPDDLSPTETLRANRLMGVLKMMDEGYRHYVGLNAHPASPVIQNLSPDTLRELAQNGDITPEIRDRALNRPVTREQYYTEDNRHTYSLRQITKINKKLEGDPHAELTSPELRFLYQQGNENIVDTLDEDDARLRRELRSKRNREEDSWEWHRKSHEERDYTDREALRSLMPEILAEQAEGSHRAYRTMTEYYQNTPDPATGEARQPLESVDEATFKELLAAQIEAWREAGVYDYMTREALERGVQFTLVATPTDALFHPDDFLDIAKKYTDRHTSKLGVVKYATYTNDEDTEWEVETFDDAGWAQNHASVPKLREYFAPNYPSKDRDRLSRCRLPDEAASEGPIHFSLMPSRRYATSTEPDLVWPVDVCGEPGRDRKTDLPKQLVREREEHPRMNLHVPSLLEGITYWHCLEERGHDPMYSLAPKGKHGQKQLGKELTAISYIDGRSGTYKDGSDREERFGYLHSEVRHNSIGTVILQDSALDIRYAIG